MNARGGLIVVVAALAAIFAWIFWPSEDHSVRAVTLNRSRPVVVAPRPYPIAPKLDHSPPEERSELADQLNSPTGTVQSDLKIVQAIIDAYRSNLHENPVGTNNEITAALSGKNSLRIALISSDHPAINLKGELCDRFGRPFFFHQLSGTQMEVRSSGPDRQMWNDDDVVLTPGAK
jgi:hypothetical protein